MPSFFKRKKDKEAKGLADGGHAGAIKKSGPELAATAPTATQGVPPEGNSPPQTNVPRDLWGEAFATLSPEDRELLRPSSGDEKPNDARSQRAAVESVMTHTEVKYKEYCQRGWRAKKGDTTKETNIRIKAREIVCSALQFKGVVDAGLKFDRSGYGTIVWGVVSSLLTLVQNDKEGVEAVFNFAAVMARFLPKYAIIEAHYRDKPTQEQGAFEDQIEEVYIAILKYAACVQKELNRSVADRLLDSFWTLDNQNVKILEVDLEGKDKIVANQSQFVSHQYRKLEFKELDGKASEALNKIDISLEKLLKAERLNTLKWLSDTNLTLSDRQQQLRSRIDKSNKNSGKWLLGSSRYTDWFEESHSFLWLQGASGCGKSSLCSTVVKSLVESAEKNSSMIIAYWYFDNGDPPTQNLQRLLRLILRRISAKATPLPEAVRDLANNHELLGSSPSTATLIETLEKAVAALEEDVFLILDAIDEYQAGNETLRAEFLDFLGRLGDAQLRKLHLLVTSIPDTDIKNSLMGHQAPPIEIDVEKPVSVDVDAYLDSTIKKCSEIKHWSPETTDKIHRVLKDDGRFRIVSLQLEDLRKCFDKGEIDAALKSIPLDIGDAYLRKLQRVVPKDAPRLARIFCWISLAARQLTTFELAAAPGVDLVNPEELLSICPSSMIRIEKQKPPDANEPASQQQEIQESPSMETEIITFDHPSVKRFLYSDTLQQSNDHQVSQFFVSEKTINAKFVGLMVDYLLAIRQPIIEPSVLIESPFLPYVAQYWHEHSKEYRNDPSENRELKDKLLALFGEPMNLAYLNWIRVWNPESKRQDFGLSQESCPSPLYMSIFLGFKGVSNHLIENCSYINDTGGLMYTAIQLASQRGCAEIIKGLIAAGEGVDRTIGDQPTALYIAVENGNAHLVEILLTAGANPDAKHSLFGPALQLASYRGFTRIVKLLVASGADVNLQSIRFGTALQAAAAAGYSEIVAILLIEGSKPDVVGGLLGTAIQAAATGGYYNIVRMLAANNFTWDEERDSTWHEAFDLWVSKPSPLKSHILTKRLLSQTFSTELLVGSDIQQMLAGVLKTLSSPPPTSFTRAMPETSSSPRIKAYRRRFTKTVSLPGRIYARETEMGEVAALGLDTQQTRSLKLAEQVRRQGQEGMESGHYVYRALFWALLYRCTASGQSEIVEVLYKLSIAISLRALDQAAIEHANPNNLVAVRHELVECYALAFQVVTEVMGFAWLDHPMLMILSPQTISRVRELIEEIERRNETVEHLMKIVRLHEPSTEVVLLGQMHRELLAKMQQEMRGGLQTLEESMHKNLEEVEKRVVASVQNILPGIIREEMRKLLAEQKGSASPDNRS